MHESHGVLGVFGVLAVAIHVDGQGAVAKTCEVAGAALGVIVEPPPFMYHHDTGARPLDRIVIGVIANQFCAIGTLVGHFLGLDGGLAEPAQGQQEQN
ncbi:hypothetical protein D3C84_1154860 [compost metagenome]